MVRRPPHGVAMNCWPNNRFNYTCERNGYKNNTKTYWSSTEVLPIVKSGPMWITLLQPMTHSTQLLLHSSNLSKTSQELLLRATKNSQEGSLNKKIVIRVFMAKNFELSLVLIEVLSLAKWGGLNDKDKLQNKHTSRRQHTAYYCQMLNRGFAILRCCYVRFAVLTH